MKNINPKYAISLILMLMVGFTHYSHSGGYMGLSATTISTDITDHNGLILTVGSEMNSFISIEGFALVSSTDDDYQGVNLSIDNLYGVNLIGSIPINDSLSPFISLGYTRAEATASYMGYSESASDSGSSVGVGIKYQLLESWSIKAQYTEYLDDVDGFSIGLTAHF